MSETCVSGDVELLGSECKEQLAKVANTIRGLSMDAVQAANSGHPGMPMGCAEIGAYLYGVALRHNPADLKWINRDRVILSAGHGSMWLYSCMHLAGFPLSLDEIKRFRQLHSLTPGHPESHITPGVETTAGPLGQGVGFAVGQALGLKILQAKFGDNGAVLFDAKVYCVAGDGCMIEAINHEVASLAGHLRLDNLVLIYDANQITLDGPLSDSCSEDVEMRYRAYGWDVVKIDGHSFDALHEALAPLRKNQKRPMLVMAKTVIGKGSPNKAGTHKVHGSPLGYDEVAAAHEFLGLPSEPFYIPRSVETFFEEKRETDLTHYEAWSLRYSQWREKEPAHAHLIDAMEEHNWTPELDAAVQKIEFPPAQAGRIASNKVFNALAEHLPGLIVGSADLSCSDMVFLADQSHITAKNFAARNIKFGEREFGMATIAAGLAQTGKFLPVIGTFLTFSDYMRNAIRLTAIMRLKVVYQFTHDSIFLGEDGPTHQPIEQVASLRAMPNLQVIRPGDSHEVVAAWRLALEYNGPTAILLSRQSLPLLEGTKRPFEEGMGRGAYVLHQTRACEKLDYTLFATGSELSLALNVAEQLEARGKCVRVVSVPCWERFAKQDAGYREEILGGELGCCVSIEAGVSQGWHQFIGRDGIAICMEGYGASAPASALAQEFGFTVDAILDRIL
ncbi:MAG: transketolase [Chlamydiia bacterium]|nr:transketolase [Chlamydiia bacterium]